MEVADKNTENPFFNEVVETQEEFVVALGLPNVDPDEIEIMLDERGMHVQAQREQLAAESVENGIFKSDSLVAGFARYIPMPVCADIEEAEAFYTNDTLLIHVPKKDAVNRRQLKVTTKKKKK
jgi:HSP20 family molecular chaperone IbpA